MTTLIFVIAIATIVFGVLAVEGDSWRFARRPTGLLTWFATGNWPAKIGAALTIVGVGALLRYAAIHIDAPPVSKLLTGVVLIAALGFASSAVDKSPARRALSLALGGAAFGVAYLTAYSSFALYGFLDDSAGLGLLAVTAIGAGVFAVTRSAQSLSVLAMLGAWIAPAFAVDDPGPLVTYGYYVAASGLTMIMVRLRGWRALTHLSFLFTLVGGVFFAWNAQYHAPEHFPVMSVMLVLLVALHVAMPLSEQRDSTNVWSARFDLAYLLTLPLTATLFAYVIAPTSRSLSALLVCLGSCWIGAALYLWVAKRSAIAAHLAIGTILVLIGAATRFQELPWALIALAVAVGALALAARDEKSKILHRILTGVVLVLGALNVLIGLDVEIGLAFRNARFYEQLCGAILLIVAARQCRRVHQSLDGLLLSVGIGWALFMLGTETIRLDLVSAILVAHWSLLATLLASCALAPKLKVSPPLGSLAVLLTLVTAGLAAANTAMPMAVASLMLAPIALSAFAVRRLDEGSTSMDRIAALVAMPIVAAAWMNRISTQTGLDAGYAPLAVAAGAGAIGLFACRHASSRTHDWYPVLAKLFGVIAAVMLAFITLLAIGRSGWAIAAEVMLLVVLAVGAAGVSDDDGSWVRNAAIVGLALVLQAHLLRWFGPDGPLTIADLADMQWPTLISLLWAALGASLTLWARRRASRSVWVAGAALLVASAVKLVVLDIGTRLGSLGDITNIVAVIAAGAVFLLVGWLAPMPPSSDDERSDTMTPREDMADRTSKS